MNLQNLPAAVVLSTACLMSGISVAQQFEFVEATIADIQSAILDSEISCQQVVAGYLARIEAYDQSRGVNAITETNRNALTIAREIDNSIARGDEQPDLFCAPLLIKDNFDTADMVTTGGSIALKDSIPPDDAFMIRKLKEAGAIVLAKTNMAEWAFSPRQSVSSSYGRTANAYDTGFVPAGSSGGTASGVAASFGVAGMGSDTGNSIRGPSSHLSLFGIRSTIGLTSRDGVIPLSFDRDIAGPMTRTVEDGVRLFNVVAGYDPADELSLPLRREDNYLDFLNAEGLQGKRIGVFRALVDHDDADPEIKEVFFRALEDLQSAGATIIDNFEIRDFEALSDAIGGCPRFRYDMWRYLQTLDEPPFLDVNEVLEAGDYAPESEQSFRYFSQGPLDTPPDEWEDPCITWPNHPERNQLLGNAITDMNGAMVDAIVFPTWSNPPARIDRGREDYNGDNNQLLVPDTGLPAVTVPMGFLQSGLPVGIQFVGRPFTEGLLIELAYAYEQATQHRRPPSGYPEL